MKRSLAVLPLLWLVASASATELHGLFTDHAVLQCGKPIPVWGTAEPGEHVTVTLAKANASVKTDKDGRWRVNLPAMEPGGPHKLVAKGTDELIREDVMIGEVWLCTGQSNMAFPLRILGYKSDPEQEDIPLLRMYTVKRKVSGAPEPNVAGTWEVSRPGQISKWSGLGFFFGRELQKKLRVPVGIVNSSVGGTPIESWMSDDALASVKDKGVQGFRKWVLRCVNNYDAMKKAHPNNKGIIAPDSPWRINGLYNGMIHPLAPYAFRGIAWYQGESNAGRAAAYSEELQIMIRSWRTLLGEAPFIVVQLAGLQGKNGWPRLRQSQLDATSLPDVGLAVAADLGHPTNIHPPAPQKVKLAHRMTLLARSLAYGEDIIAEGPRAKEAHAENKQVRISFRSVGGGLTVKGEGLTGFELAGDDGEFHDATASIDGEHVLLKSNEVPAPTSVRYGWNSYPELSLYNREDLPAPPFALEL